MIRVFLLAMLGLVALVMVAHNLPAYLRAPAADQADIFGRWEGVWEGTSNTYLMDGTSVESSAARHEHTRVSDTEQRLVITNRFPDGRILVTSGELRLVGDRFECRLSDERGVPEVLTGWKTADGIVLRSTEPAAGFEAISFNEIVPTSEGDLYTVSGIRAPKDGREMRLFQGRYHRVKRAGE
jgi:hypothetical protein